jgi:hypothetical protein
MQPKQASRADAIRRWTDYLESHFLRSAFALRLNNSTPTAVRTCESGRTPVAVCTR